MKKRSHYFLAGCILAFGIIPSNAFASYALSMVNPIGCQLGNSSAYYCNFGGASKAFSQSADAASLIVPASGTITAIYGNLFTVIGGSDEPCKINLIKNGTTKIQVINSAALNNINGNPFSNSSLNVAVVAGDVLQMQIETPAWEKPPYAPSFSISLYIE